MRERRAQVVLVVRAFEEADPDGRLLPPVLREEATRRALAVTGLIDFQGRPGRNPRNEETIFRRARLLLDALGRKYPTLLRILNAARHGFGFAPLIVVAALCAGFAGTSLEGGREVDILSFFVLGLVAWNLAVYLLALARVVARGRAPRSARREDPGGQLVARVAGGFLRWPLWRALRAWSRVMEARPEEARIAAEALRRFAVHWQRVARPLMLTRARMLLHLAAVAFAAGAVVGMVGRGLACEYRASWESAWLGERQVQFLVNTLLWPAATVLGKEVPDVAPLRGPGRSGDARPWIQLYGMSALLFVGVPRALLAAYQGWRARKLARDLPVDLEAAYFRRIFTAWRGVRRRVEVVAYGYRPGPSPLSVLKTLLYDFFGARTDIRVREAVAYGEEADAEGVQDAFHPATPAGDDFERCHVVVFYLAQTPEEEVHGRFLEALRAHVRERAERLLVLLDASSYWEAAPAPERVRERHAAWERLLREHELTAVEVELGREGAYPATDELMDRLRLALWPPEEAALVRS